MKNQLMLVVKESFDRPAKVRWFGHVLGRPSDDTLRRLKVNRSVVDKRENGNNIWWMTMSQERLVWQ